VLAQPLGEVGVRFGLALLVESVLQMLFERVGFEVVGGGDGDWTAETTIGA